MFVNVCKCGVWLHAEVKESDSDIYSYNLNHANNEIYAVQCEDVFYWLKEYTFFMAVCMRLYASSPVAHRISSARITCR